MSSLLPPTADDLAAPLRSKSTLTPSPLHPIDASTSNKATGENPGQWDRVTEVQFDAQLRDSLPPTSLELLERFCEILRRLTDEDGKFQACYVMRRRLQWLQSMGVKSDNIFLAFRRAMERESLTVRHLSEVFGVGDGSTCDSWALDSWTQFFGVAHEAEQCWRKGLESTLRPGSLSEASGITDTRNGLDRKSDTVADAHIPAPLVTAALQSPDAPSTLNKIESATSTQHHILHEQTVSFPNGLLDFKQPELGGVAVELLLRVSSTAGGIVVKTETGSGGSSGLEGQGYKR